MATVFSKGKRRTTLALEVDGVDVRFRTSMKILGVVCDERLDWNKHAAYVKARVKQRAGMLSRICGRTWGVSPDTAIYVYKVWVRPMIEYAWAIWGDISATPFSELASVQHRFLCRALGVRYPTSAAAVRAETGIPPLELRRDTATLTFHDRVARQQGPHSLGRLFTKLNRDGSDRLVHPTWSSVHERARRLRQDLTRRELAMGRAGLVAREARKWQEEWARKRNAAAGAISYHSLRPSVPPSAAQLTRNRVRRSHLMRAESSALTGLRVRSSLLRSRLARQGLVSSARCQQCATGQQETTDHFLFDCPRYAR